MLVRWLSIWFRPNWGVNSFSFEHPVVLVSFEYQLAHLALETPIKVVDKGSKRDTVSRLYSKLSKNVLDFSWF